jgi:N4-(beta-N-acetylglucosaminyl)-L-asparaginase
MYSDRKLVLSVLIWTHLRSVFASSTMVNPIIVNTWPFTAPCHAGYLVLTSSRNADPIDAVVSGCSKAEELQCDHTVGWGGSPDSNGETTLDALVMRGSDQDMGAVAGLRNVRDATKVARDVMRLTKHSVLAGELATEFAVKLGYAEINLSSEYSRKLHREWVRNGCKPNFWKGDRNTMCEACNGTNNVQIDEHNHDTIGQIALQSDGRMAVGMSSNGARHKIAGRVGDAPLPGAGGFVDDEIGACVATGDGDVMMRYSPAFLGVELMRNGMTPLEAAEAAVARISRKNKGFSGAVVCVSNKGEHAAASQGFQKFSYSVQSGGSTESDVEVIEVKPLTAPTKEQRVLMESLWGIA